MTRNFLVDDYVHIYNRGSRKMPIIYDDNDKWYFLKTLRYFNNEFPILNIFRELDFLRKLGNCPRFEWPKEWPQQKPLVKILSYHLSPNHFHLLLRETHEGGISKFMKKFGSGFTNYINAKYTQSGSLFQGPYKANTIREQRILEYIDAYIQVFNPFELFNGGIKVAIENFDEAFKFALEYPFCSLGESFGKRSLHIIHRDIFETMFENIKIYKEFIQDALMVRNIRESIGKFAH